MYLSFDSGTITSNIANIDLEQVIDCFAQEIILLIKKGEKEGNSKSRLGKKKQEKDLYQNVKNISNGKN